MDLQIRAISEKHNVKISIVDISESMKQICELQETNPLVSFAMAKFSVGNVLVSIDNKDNSKITTTYSSNNGFINRLINQFINNEISSSVKVRDFGLNDFDDQTNPLDLVVGTTGELLFTRDMGLKKPYASNVSTDTSDFDDIFMNFLRESSQITSLVASDVILDDDLKIKKVIGILIQLLPGYNDEDIDMLENKIGNTKHLTNVLLESTNYYEVIKDIIEDAKILETKELVFACTCNYEKILSSIKMLGKVEIKKIISDEEHLRVHCDFCNRLYIIKPNDLKNIVK